MQSKKQLPFHNTLLGSLAKATEALVNAVAAKESKEAATTNAEGKSLRTILREEAEADHKLDHLRFMDKMVEAQAALNLKAGNALPIVAMAQQQTATVTTAPLVVANHQDNVLVAPQSIQQFQNQQFVVHSMPSGQLPAQPTAQASSLHRQSDPKIPNGPGHCQQQQYQQYFPNNSELQMQFQYQQSPQFLQQSHYQQQDISPAVQYNSNKWSSCSHQHYDAFTSPQAFDDERFSQYYQGTRSTGYNDAQYTMQQQAVHGAQLLDRSLAYQQQQMGYHQPNRGRGNQQQQFAQSSSNQWASPSVPDQNSSMWGRR